MKFNEVMCYFKYKMSNIAKALKVSRHSVYAWRDTDRIPYHHQCNLQIMSAGELKASYADAGENPPTWNQQGWDYDKNTDARV